MRFNKLLTLLVLTLLITSISAFAQENNAPSISWDWPIEGATFNQGDYTYVQVFVNDESNVDSVTLTVDGPGVSDSIGMSYQGGTTWQSVVDAYFPNAGTYSFFVSATDEWGNTAHSQIGVVVVASEDTEAPFLEILNPVNQDSYPVSSLISLEVIASDDRGIDYVEAFVQDPAGSYALDLVYNGGDSYVGPSDIYLSFSGAYTITVTAYDTSGNFNVQEITIYAQDEPEFYGCTDPMASNYDPMATSDDGSCFYEYWGCTDPGAANYDPMATMDDGSCYTIDTWGCTDPGAMNWDPMADVDDGSCMYDNYDMEPPQIINTVPQNWDNIVAGSTTELSATVIDDSSIDYVAVNIQGPGGMDYANIFPAGGDLYSIFYQWVDVLGGFNAFVYGTYILNWEAVDEHGNWAGEEVYVNVVGPSGCTDPFASNYDPNAYDDDGSCVYPDADGDGVGDHDDVCPDTPQGSVVGWAGCTQEQIDPDGDGWCNFETPNQESSWCIGIDICPGVFDPAQGDADNDGLGDACDTCTDIDGDGFGEPGYLASTCSPDTCVGYNDLFDGDLDGVANGCDNCPRDFNPDQADSDGGPLGDLQSITFHVSHADCSFGNEQFNFYINGIYIGSGGGNFICDCTDDVQSYTFTDANTLSAWTSGDNMITFESGFEHHTGYVTVTVEGAHATITQTLHGDSTIENICDQPDLNSGIFIQEVVSGAGVSDGAGDVCDVCPFAIDPDQADLDGDGQGDACDVCTTGQECNLDSDCGNGLCQIGEICARPDPVCTLGTRTDFVGGPGGGPCHVYDGPENQEACENAYAESNSGEVVSCWFETNEGHRGPGSCNGCGSQARDQGWCYNACTTPEPVCGNGILEVTELCDDGNGVNGDGCENDCTVTPPVCIDETKVNYNGFNGGCRQPDLDADPALCESTYTRSGQTGEPVACVYDYDGIFNGGCYACGPNAGWTGCQNTCVAPPNCDADPSNTIFVGDHTGQWGDPSGTCHDFDNDEPSCNNAWIINSNGDAVSCFHDGVQCMGCGPNNEQNGFCTNTCFEAPVCEYDQDRTFNNFNGGCRQPELDADPVLCESTYTRSGQTGEAVACVYDYTGQVTGGCYACGPNNEGNGVCNNICKNPAPICGDGVQQPGEQCDDGNTANGDGCEADCTLTPIPPPTCEYDQDRIFHDFNGACHNFFLDSEGCEAAYTRSGQTGEPVACIYDYDGTGPFGPDSCYACGPNNEGNGFCNNICQNPAPVCGDGIVGFGESCDDGNTVGGDGCEANCQLPPPICHEEPERSIFIGDHTGRYGDPSDAYLINSNGQVTSCYYDGVFSCNGCGSNSESLGACENVCDVPPTCEVDPTRTNPGNGFNFCDRYTGDTATCESSFTQTEEGEVVSCFVNQWGGCQACSSHNVLNGECVNTCFVEPTCELQTDREFVGVGAVGEFFSPCNVHNGDKVSCDGAYASVTGEPVSCWYDSTGWAYPAGTCAQCDESIEGQTCLNLCTTPEPICGDGNQDLGEVCDDGNGQNGDGCENDCTLTPPACVQQPDRTFLGPGQGILCQQMNDANSCNDAYIDRFGETISCFWDNTGAQHHAGGNSPPVPGCYACGPNNEQSGFCNNVCRTPECHELPAGDSCLAFGCEVRTADVGFCSCDNCFDNDGDGYGTEGSTTCPNGGVDCDDSNPDVNPGVVIDSDGDGVADEFVCVPQICQVI
jgi:cysteine-rich repeat protein